MKTLVGEHYKIRETETGFGERFEGTGVDISANNREQAKERHTDPVGTFRAERSGVDFVRIADVCFERDLAFAYFVICGFPGMWSTASNPDGEMKGRLLQYGTYSFKGTTSGLLGFDSERHLLLEGTPGDLLDQNGEPTRFQTRSGHPASMPGDLAGISGSSVWRVGDLRIPVSEWNINAVQIVGVQTGVFRSAGAIKATRWNAVATLLHAACADLRATLEMYSST